jgi:hypothetical protein
MDARCPVHSLDGIAEDILGLRAEFARIRRDLDRLSGRISVVVDDALAGVYQLRALDERLDAMFACAAEFARGARTAA